MRTEHIETVIVGAGQAGLATGYHLQRAGRPFVILDGESRVGDGWRNQWDTLRLFSPAWADSLPGMPNPGPRWSYPTKDEFADYLEAYAVRFDLPVRLATRVTSVARDGDGFVVTTGESRIECDDVVLCTGTFGRTPRVPSFADQLDPSIRQLHSSEYRRPSQLADGTVLVVGASHSGCDIAYEVAATRPTVMVGPDTGQIPVAFTSPLLKVVFPAMLLAFSHVLTRSNPVGRKARQEFRHGGPRLRVQRRDLAERGVDWVQGRVVGAADGRPVLDDGRVVEARTVIWCTGFRQASTGCTCRPSTRPAGHASTAGSSTTARGCASAASSSSTPPRRMIVHGVGRDAAYVAARIGRRHAGIRMRNRVEA